MFPVRVLFGDDAIMVMCFCCRDGIEISTRSRSFSRLKLDLDPQLSPRPKSFGHLEQNQNYFIKFHF